MRGRQEVNAIFARLFDDVRLREALLEAGDDEARRDALRREGFGGDYTMADVQAEARQLLLSGRRASSPGRPVAPSWEPGPGQIPADAPFHVKEARRAAPVFGRLAMAGSRRPSGDQVADEIRATYAVVGTVKGGTSVLHHFLGQHPLICTAVQKETHFFCRDIFFEGDGPSYEWYSLSFSLSFSGEEAVGEATPDYMYFPQIAPRLAEYNPEMRLIFLLRNPVARAYSDYCMRVGRGIERRTFSAVIDEEAALLERGGDVYPKEIEVVPRYLGAGFYMRFVRRFLELFPRRQMLLVRSEDLLDAHHRTLAEVHAFLGVGSERIPEPRSVLKGSGPPMESADKRRLLDLYETEMSDLERFTGWDMRRWRA